MKVDLNETKNGLGNVRWKSSNNNTFWNISVAFLESSLAISEANECLTNVNIKDEAKPTSSEVKQTATSEDEYSAINREENKPKAI